MLFKKIILFVILIVGSACSPLKNDSPQLLKEYQQGELRLAVKALSLEIDSSELLYLTLEAEAPEGSDFIFLEEEFSFGELQLFESHLSKLKLNSKEKAVQTLRLVLEPDLPGIYTLPALTVQSGNNKIVTDELQIDVKSVIPQGQESLQPQAGFSTVEYSKWLLPVLVIVVLLLIIFVKILKKSETEELDIYKEFSEQIAASKSYADLPRIFCQFAGRLYNSPIVYTGSQGTIDFLIKNSLSEELLNEARQLLLNYEECRFSGQSSTKLDYFQQQFTALMKKLERL